MALACRLLGCIDSVRRAYRQVMLTGGVAWMMAGKLGSYAQGVAVIARMAEDVGPNRHSEIILSSNPHSARTDLLKPATKIRRERHYRHNGMLRIMVE